MPPACFSRSAASHASVALLSFVLALPAGCDESTAADPTPPQPPDSTAEITLTPVATGLSQPLYLTAPAGDERLFIVEKTGRIRIVKDGALLEDPFLDLRGTVSTGSEQGLLSVAFHPDYASNGFFYVDYTDADGDTRVVRYSVSAADPDVADPASAKLVLAVEQPFANHNGGLLLFGPDGMLYVGLGDGGSGGDPRGNGQNLGTLLGKILRIDVDAGEPYAIPPDNPFVGHAGARAEIWAYGLRNPWRFAFDTTAGLLYIADVGQNAWEEIDVVDAAGGGQNFGWNIMEGAHCYGASSCDQSGLTLPALEYSHSEGCSITGGFVYRGKLLPAATGQYFYSDYCTSFLRSFSFADGVVTGRFDWSVAGIGRVQSFGVDAEGEMYVLSNNGTVYRMGETAGAAPASPPRADAARRRAR